MSELKGSKTYDNLAYAFAGESEARTKYSFFASKAKSEGYEQISAFFAETSDNEKEHAKIWYKLLNDGVGDTMTNLKIAADGEHEEWTNMYSEFERIAREEGFDSIAEKFKLVGAVEKEHEERYRALIENLEKGRVFKRDMECVWICRNCGHVYIGKDAPEKCPTCDHPQAYFELREKNY